MQVFNIYITDLFCGELNYSYVTKFKVWMNDGYTVAEDSTGQWFIVCTANDSAIGLTWQDGVTLNGKPEQFYTR